MSKLLILLSILSVIYLNESAKILAVFPMPSISHQVVFRHLTQELAKRGHELVVITPDPAFAKGQSPQNLTEIDIHDLSYKIWNRFLESGQAQAHITPLVQKGILKTISEVFIAQVISEDIQKLINDKNKKFDLVFVETCVRPSLIFSYLYKVPVIAFSTLGGVFGGFDGSGVPMNPIVYPLPLSEKLYNLSLWEKIWVLYSHYATENIIKEQDEVDTKMLRRIFGPKVPDLSEMKKKIQMFFFNVQPIWDFNRPVPSNVIYIGGIHQMPAKELPGDFKAYLDSSKNGVIYMSFGTNARSSLLPPEKVKIFIKVFSQLPYDIVWKWDEDHLPGVSKNVRISKWFQQSDLLKHPKVKLFITQGGLQSTDEALAAGVPLIVVPLLGDQWFNAEKYTKLNIGIRIDLETITEDKLKNAIETIISNNTYRENVVRLHKLMHDQPQSPLERAVWWTEYVLRHGGATHLRSAAAHMHWTEYYVIDLVLLALAVFSALLIGSILAIRFVIVKFAFMPLKIKMKVN